MTVGRERGKWEKSLAAGHVARVVLEATENEAEDDKENEAGTEAEA